MAQVATAICVQAARPADFAFVRAEDERVPLHVVAATMANCTGGAT
jgi:hypothetical protein